MRNGWYIERWDRAGQKAEEQETMPDSRSLLSVIRILMRICPASIVRVLVPASATTEELEQLKSLGAVLA
jgi:hypothetical protein